MLTRGFKAARAIVSLLLVAAMILGIAATALAQEGNNGRGKEKAFKAGFKMGERFGDLKEAQWADRFVTEAQLAGIIKGYEERGRFVFKPNQPVNRQEAVAMVIRGTGLEVEAKKVADSVYGVQLPYQDAGQIQSWAAGYVSVALQKGYIASNGGMFQPHKAASRVWVVPVLVRAMGLEAEAQQRMNEQLTFADASSIPADAVGYVAVAIDAGLIQGYENNTFRPFLPVTRAQMAKMLQVVRDDLQGEQQAVTDGVVRGVVSAVDGNTIRVVSVNRVKKDYTVADGARIYLDDRPATLADLKAGQLVRIYLGTDGTAILVDAHTARALEPPGKQKPKHPRERELRGLVTDIDPAAFTLTMTVGGQERTFEIAESAKVNVRGEGYGTLDDIQVGDVVQVHLRGDLVVKIQVKGQQQAGDEDEEDSQTDAAQTTELKGVITAITDGGISVDPDQGDPVAVTVDANTRIELGGQVATLADLKLGDRVKVELSGSTAVKIKMDN